MRNVEMNLFQLKRIGFRPRIITLVVTSSMGDNVGDSARNYAYIFQGAIFSVVVSYYPSPWAGDDHPLRGQCGNLLVFL
jgi:hypothetical protein